MQVIELSDEKQLELYMRLPKEDIAKMLLQCNKVIKQILPIVQYGEINNQGNSATWNYL